MARRPRPGSRRPSDAIDWSIAHPKEAATLFTKAYPPSGSTNYNIIGWTYTAGLMKGPDGYFKQIR